MFRRLPESGGPVMIRIDGRSVEARAGDTVAAAMLAAGIVRTRVTSRHDVPRGPYCAMGACFDCLVTIDGVGNRRACMVPVADGMRVDSQGSKRDLAR
jgi:predicted molibdopterin-dependent oxidoreductase YjgC